VGEQSLVLLSVDGRGRVSLYYPKEGTRPLTIEPGERHLLPESIELDDAPDFELFLAYFGADDAAVPLREVEAIFANDGLDGLLRMVEASPDMDAILLRKEKAGGR
jgi:hypothetical protein